MTIQTALNPFSGNLQLLGGEGGGGGGGGWFVLNAEKYRKLITRAVANERSKIRMQNKRARDKNAVTQQLRPVTPSVSVSNHQNQSGGVKKRPFAEEDQKSCENSEIPNAKRTLQTIREHLGK